METDLVFLSCTSEAIDAARGNLYRPPLVRIVTRGASLVRFAVTTGACPLKVVRRLGFDPVALLLKRGVLGTRPAPDELIVEVSSRIGPLHPKGEGSPILGGGDPASGTVPRDSSRVPHNG